MLNIFVSSLTLRESVSYSERADFMPICIKASFRYRCNVTFAKKCIALLICEDTLSPNIRQLFRPNFLLFIINNTALHFDFV